MTKMKIYQISHLIYSVNHMYTSYIYINIYIYFEYLVSVFRIVKRLHLFIPYCHNLVFLIKWKNMKDSRTETVPITLFKMQVMYWQLGFQELWSSISMKQLDGPALICFVSGSSQSHGSAPTQEHYILRLCVLTHQTLTDQTSIWFGLKQKDAPHGNKTLTKKLLENWRNAKYRTSLNTYE